MSAIAILAAVAAVAAPAPAPAQTAPHGYDLQVRLIQGGRLIAAPHLVAAAGETATFAQRKGEDGWSLKLTASPKGDADIALALDLDVASMNGRTHQKTAVTMRGRPGQPLSIDVPAMGEAPPVQVEVSAAPA